MTLRFSRRRGRFWRRLSLRLEGLGRCCGGQSPPASEAGQAVVWVAVMLPLLLSVVGLSIDGGMAFTARRELQNVADAAARAGAMQIDLGRYRATDGATVVLDVPRARQAAAAVLTGQDNHLTATIAAEERRLVVQVRREMPTAFVRLVGISTIEIAATAPAELRFGVERGNG